MKPIRVQVPCPNCKKNLSISKRQLDRHRDFQIGCPYCHSVVSARRAYSAARRTQGPALRPGNLSDPGDSGA
jgi:ssDNA-binding Zn-finger/Zn-ribbon topoisomerase 1